MSDTPWQCLKKNNSERGKYLLETGIWSDCTFIISSGEIKKEYRAHKLILSMTSPVFEKMFHSGLVSKEEKDIEIDDCDSDAFGAVLNYIYTGEMKIGSFDEAFDMYYIAKKYMLTDLIYQCTSYLNNSISYKHACSGFELAKLYEEHEIMEKYRQIILNEISSIVTLANFPAINISTLKMILGESSLNISELVLFQAVERWIRAEFERKEISGIENLEKQRQLCAKIIPHICFLSMNPKEFAEGPANSNLLTKDEVFAILMNISSPNSGYAMPKGFSKMIRKNRTNIVKKYQHLENRCYNYAVNLLIQEEAIVPNLILDFSLIFMPSLRTGEQRMDITDKK